MLKAPFPWFGGKSRVAHLVWQRFGDVGNYVEPFAGSLAVLLGRPSKPRIETVNDADRYLVNFWRAVKHAPEVVAHYADWPVSEVDLRARHDWLVTFGRQRLERLDDDPEDYDPKIAGWWVWGISCWIGGGWCAKRKSKTARRPHVGSPQGVFVRSDEDICRLASRLRRVKILCGDWRRAVTDGVLAHGEPKAVFLDPPYDNALRATGCYNKDNGAVAVQCREWAIVNGARFRIALCGFEAEHAEDMPSDWDVVAWKSVGNSYGQRKDGTGHDNSARERIWFSPACLGFQRSLF